MIRTGLSQKYFITWEALAEAIIKRDFVFKKYGFGYSLKMQKPHRGHLCEIWRPVMDLFGNDQVKIRFPILVPLETLKPNPGIPIK